MRFLELHLRAVGPFTGLVLDLSQGNAGVHVIYGRNEAGKSSALRSLCYLLFGFPTKTDDNFIHAYQSLRVGARISNDGGDELEFLRRKVNKLSLRKLDDTTVIDEQELRHFLGRIDQTLFTTFFGIDHSTLVQGGKDIVKGEGDIGEVLFTASGVSQLHAVLESLQAEADALFLPSARAKKPLNDMLSKLEAARIAIRKSQLPVQEWDDHTKALAKAQARKREAESQIQTHSTERNRLERIKTALPLTASRSDLLTAQDELASVFILPDDFPDRRREIEEHLRVADIERARASSAIRVLRNQVSELEVPQTLLEQREVIEPVVNRLGVYQQAESDRPGLEAQLHQLESEASDTLRRIDRDLEISAADSLQLSEPDRIRIRTLGTQYDGLVGSIDRWRNSTSDTANNLQRTRARLDELRKAPDTISLQAAIRKATRLGDIEDNLETARRGHQTNTTELTIELKKLQLWLGTADELEVLAVPVSQTLERFDAEFSTVDQKLRDLRRDLENCSTDALNLDAKLDQLRRGEEIPSEASLRSARDQRNEGWRLIRRSWKQDEEDADENDAFLAELATGDTDIATAFETVMYRCDEVADRLRQEAGRMAALAQLQTQRDELLQRSQSLNQQLAEPFEAHQELLQRWKELWQPIGVDPLPPREMLAWTVQQSELAQRNRLVRQNANQVQQLEKDLSENSEQLKTEIERASGQSVDKEASLSELLTIAQALLTSISENAQSHRELTRDVDRLTIELANAEEKASQAQGAFETWQSEWKEATKALPLGPDHGPPEANALLELINTLSQQVKEGDGLRRRILQIDDVSNQFRQSVEVLAGRLAPELKDSPADQAAAQLRARLLKAISAAETLDLLTNQLSGEEENLERAMGTIEELRRQLTDLCKEADCSTSEELPAAERRSKQRQSINEQLDRLDDQLRQLSAGQSLSLFVEEVRAADGDTLEPRLQHLEQETEELNRELKNEIGESIGAEKTKLDQMGVSPDAIQSAEEAQDLVARIASNAEDYARMKLSLVVLKKAIDRYRERHKAPVLRRASEIFSALTDGSFMGLHDDYDEDGKPKLVGIRSETHEPLPIGKMSDGTADQVYLAARLSWLENYFSEHERMPFIVDDVLIRFDNERAVATLRALGDLSRHTQVLFFTHHQHLVNLAEQVLDDDVLFIHELPKFPPSAALRELAKDGSR